MTESKKEPAYRRGKYKPSEKPRKKRALVEGSVRWWQEQGLNQYQAKQKVKETLNPPVIIEDTVEYWMSIGLSRASAKKIVNATTKAKKILEGKKTAS